MTRMLERHADGLFGPVARRNAVCIDITPAAHWWLSESPKVDWDDSEDFPRVVSPWPLAWYEFEEPKFYNENGALERASGEIKARGYWVSCEELPPGTTLSDLGEQPFPVPRLAAEWEAGIEASIHRRMFRVEFDNDEIDHLRRSFIENAMLGGLECRWALQIEIYAERYDHLVNVMGVLLFYLDQEGRIIPGLGLQSPAPAFEEIDRNFLLTWHQALLFSLSLLHCKNVEIIPARESKVAQKWKKRKNVSMIFKTLLVKSIRKQAEQETEPGGNSAKRALHIVRGHFKDYRATGLFGKLQGVYWWDMHARGKAEYGIVKKDYKLDTPSNLG